ncbi:piggyBac transposable element-derived protein 4-like isoform X2 [Ostrinia furnacalis]|uniref:piggyBac transposable element-derived protein 4-like isoform X2 n=1 Tax=Ostrinia furnacalis TaxID=93504 RepID=UPI001040D7D1|nr:piggyBac transposable element-derived protein 4-like isoform X2 [Ostrinia furnacalis]
MAWRVGIEPPKSYLHLLYEHEEEAIDLGVDVIKEESDDEEDVGEYEMATDEMAPDEMAPDEMAPDEVAPGSFTEHFTEHLEGTRSRSRSPHTVTAIYNEEGDLLEERKNFYDPDAHSLFLPVEQKGESRRIKEENRGQESRRGRGRRRLPGRGQRRVNVRRRWTVGDPLTEVCVDDDDVPEVLKTMVMNVIRNRIRKRKARNNIKREDTDDECVDDDFLDVDREFTWSDMESFVPEEEEFLQDKIGAVIPSQSPYEAFRRYWDDEIIEHIVTETNRYATSINSQNFQTEWFPTNGDEILCLFAFWIMLGIIRMPTIKSCFSRDPLLQSNVFRKIFSYKRYTHLSRALNFFDLTASSDGQIDILSSILPIIDHLNSRFQNNYILGQNICINESLTLWKDKLRFKEYIRSKATKFGIKTFELCESATGYLWSFFVYTGKDTDDDSKLLHKSTKIVLKLVRPLFNKGYKLFMDNWFNSPLLARFLKRNGTDCVGTLRPSRQDVPPLVNLAKLKQGQFIARHSGDVCVMAWQDKKKITTLSTCHGIATGLSTVTSRPSKPIAVKPQVVLDYNRNMGGVDLKDQMLEPYLVEGKRCTKWYMKLFKRLLNCSILNSRILLQFSKQAHQDHLAFRLKLVDEILELHLENTPRSVRPESFQSSSSASFHGHWPIHHPQRESDASRNRKTQQKCYFCLQAGRKNSKTAYRCEACNVSLCIEPCFKEHHTIRPS